MILEIIPVTSDTIGNIPRDFFEGVNCRWCAYWEAAEEFPNLSPEESYKRKREWLLSGPAPRAILALREGKVIGYAQFAPAGEVPAARLYEDRPSRDALLLTCIAVSPESRGTGVGSALVARVVETAAKLGFTKIEAYGSRIPESPTAPLGFLQKVGFRLVGSDERFPLVRMEI